MAETVVQLTTLRAGEHFVRLDHLAESILRVRRLRNVRMKLTRKPPECALDLVGARSARHAEKLVVIALGCRHASSVAGPSVVLVDLFDEARELLGRSSHRPDRLVVVHSRRPEQADCAE